MWHLRVFLCDSHSHWCCSFSSCCSSGSFRRFWWVNLVTGEKLQSWGCPLFSECPSFGRCDDATIICKYLQNKGVYKKQQEYKDKIRSFILCCRIVVVTERNEPWMNCRHQVLWNGIRLSFRLDVIFSRFASWSDNRLSRWFIDHFLLSFQLSNMIFSATVNAIRMKVWSRCGIVGEERWRGVLRLRISDSFPVTSSPNRHDGLVKRAQI